MLTIHQLQVFVTIADHRSIRRAAEQLVVTQPAVSASLAALERAVGVELVERHGRGIELTKAGLVLEEYARNLLAMVDEAMEAARFADHPESAPVRLGATTASADHMLMPLLAKVRDARPDLQFALEVANRARVWQMLAERAIDVAICSRPPSTLAFESLATRPNEFVLVSRPGTVWAGKLAEATWLIREEGSSSRAATEEVMARLSVNPTTITIGSNAAIQRSAEAGIGVALLPAEAVAQAVTSRALATIRTAATPLRQPWHVIVRAGEALASSTRQFVDDLVNLAGEFEFSTSGTALVLQRSR